MLRDLLDERDRTQKQAVSAALSAQEKAVGKAETAAEKRFDSVNEFRAQLSDQANTFMPRAEAEAIAGRLGERMQELATAGQSWVTRVEMSALIDRQAERITELTDRVNRAEGKGAGLSAAWIYALAAIGAIGTLVSIYLATRS